MLVNLSKYLVACCESVTCIFVGNFIASRLMFLFLGKLVIENKASSTSFPTYVCRVFILYLRAIITFHFALGKTTFRAY